MSTSLLLDTALWDLTVDAYGDIAVCAEPYSTAQDVACTLRLFQGELWYDQTQGLPYFQRILGHLPSIQFLKSQFEAAALTVPSVATATAYITGFTNREVTGQVQVTLTSGAQATVGTQAGVPWYVLAVTPQDTSS